MIRVAVFLAGVSLAQAGGGVVTKEHAGCILDSAEAVDELLDSATYIWASVKRCGTGADGDKLLCAMDVSATVEAVNAMVNMVLKGVEGCGALEGEHKGCGLAVGVMTKTFAGVSQDTTGLMAKCPDSLNGGKPKSFLVQQPDEFDGKGAFASAASSTEYAECMVDVKDLTVTLFKTIKRVSSIKGDCSFDKMSPSCTHDALKLVATFAGIGKYVASTVTHCGFKDKSIDKVASGCSKKALGLVSELTRLGSAAVEMNKACVEGEERLYALEHSEEIQTQTGSNSSMTLALALLLPLTAVLSFVGGSRFAKSRNRPEDCMAAEDQLLVE